MGSFTVGPPLPLILPPRPRRRESKAVLKPQDESFLGFPFSPCVSAWINKRSQEALEKDKSVGATIGKIIPSSVCRINDRKYVFSMIPISVLLHCHTYAFPRILCAK